LRLSPSGLHGTKVVVVNEFGYKSLHSHLLAAKLCGLPVELALNHGDHCALLQMGERSPNEGDLFDGELGICLTRQACTVRSGQLPQAEVGCESPLHRAPKAFPTAGADSVKVPEIGIQAHVPHLDSVAGLKAVAEDFGTHNLLAVFQGNVVHVEQPQCDIVTVAHLWERVGAEPRLLIGVVLSLLLKVGLSN
jgi:hypothetical protein